MSEPGGQEPQPPQQPPYGQRYGQPLQQPPPNYGPQYGQQYGQPAHPGYGQPQYAPPAYPAAAPVVGNPGRTAVVVGLVLLLLSFAAGGTAGVVGYQAAYQPLKEAFANPILTTPVDQKMTLRAAEYTVYEETLDASDFDDSTFDDSTVATGPGLTVTVTGPGGESLEVSESGTLTETLDRNATRFVGVAKFTVATPGEYTVAVVSEGEPARLVVGPSLGGFAKQAGGSLAAAFGLGFLSFVLFWAGLITLIVGLVKRSKAKRSREALLSAPGGLAPPSGPSAG